MAPAANDDYDPIPARRDLSPAAAAFVGVVVVLAGCLFGIGVMLGYVAGKGWL